MTEPSERWLQSIVEDWDKVSPSGQEAIARFTHLLASEKWTGNLVFYCAQGGVRDWDESRKRTPRP